MDYKIRANQMTLTVQRREFFKYGSGEKLNDILRIGGRNTCVEFKYTDNPRVELLWLHTSGQHCNDENIDIRGTKTADLLYISVQVLKTYLPTATYLDFLDNSHYPCIVSGKPVKIFLNHYYFVYNGGKTWYDAKFGAYPTDPKQREQYNSFADNFNNPEMKPDAFDFMNDELNSLFQPIWAKTTTWNEFIGEIRGFPNLCQKSYPWYYRASNCIRVNMPMPEQWTIDIEGNQRFPSVERCAFICDAVAKPSLTRAGSIAHLTAAQNPPSREQGVAGGRQSPATNGGRRKTRKRRNTYEYDISVCPDFANPTER